MKKINWLLRPQAKPGRSIEQLFFALKSYIEEKVELNVIELPGNGSLKKDIWLQRKFVKQLPKADLTHVLGDVHYLAPWIQGKQVHTFHDLESLLQGPLLLQKLKKQFWLKNMFRNAQSVSVISEHSKNQLLHYYPQHENLIRVISNPLIFKPQGKQVNNNELFQFLSIGTKSNKNLFRIAEALSKISVNYNWHIVGSLNDEQKQYFTSNSVVFTNHLNLTDRELSNLYTQSDLLLFPSLYEGFGLPIVEAQAHGVPVLTSNVTAMPEVGGDSVFYVNPLEVDEIRQGVLNLIENESLKSSLITKGFENIKRFEIENIAQKYMEWYDGAMGS